MLRPGSDLCSVSWMRGCLLCGTADRPQLVCEQVRYEARLHATDVTLQCLVRSHPAINASQALYSWTTLSGRNESITAGQRDGHCFADLLPGVCSSNSQSLKPYK